MTLKEFFIRFAGFILVALAAGPLYAVTFNLLVLLNIVPLELADKAFGTIVTTRATYVWLTCLLPGFASIFIRAKWRLLLYFAPLFAPSLFAVFFTFMQR